MILNETYSLANGVQVPKLGLGTWFIDDAEAAEAVREAVKLGYRLIDTAQAYGNERGVGEGVRTCGVRREELFVASKIAAELKTYEDAAKSIDETLERMGLGYLDQMIIHSPQPWSEFRVEKRYFEENKEVWRALEDARAAGKVKVIGVSNFLQDDLENLLRSCRVMPMVNQILLHITNTDSALVDFCKAQASRWRHTLPLPTARRRRIRRSLRWQRCTAYLPPSSASATSFSLEPSRFPRRQIPPTWKATRAWISQSPRKTWKLSRTWSASPTMVNSAHFPCSVESLLHEEKA